MRIISAAVLNTPITVAIEDHLLTVIASDGNPVVPLNASSLVVYPGECVVYFTLELLQFE